MIQWPAESKAAQWDLPPPAFSLADYDFVRAAPPAGAGAPATAATEQRWPSRLPEAEWLHQPHWVRWRHAGNRVGPRRPTTLAVVTAVPLPPAARQAFEAAYDRVVTVVAAGHFARLAADEYQVDPADLGSLRQLLDALGGGDFDWLHALPLAVAGPVDVDTLARAYWACVDTPAALLAAVAELPHRPRIRAWWLSHHAQPVPDGVRRPELGLLAGACEVAAQEAAVESHWLDLPSAEPAEWTPAVSALLATSELPPDATPERPAEHGLPRRLALREGYWWEQALLPVRPATTTLPALPVGPAVYLVLGGTGGIGRSIAAWLLEQGDCRVVLLARRGRLPTVLEPWADRIELVEADLAETAPDELVARLAQHTRRVDGIVHAAGVAAGGLITRRDAAAMRSATAGKVRGALLVEHLVVHYQPAFVVYCSSMSAQLGGVGQLDYAAANGLLAGFARHGTTTTEATLRIVVDWDVWHEVGIAREALPTDARHRAHLAVGLSVAEGRRLFAQALRLRLPHLLVCTTALDQARSFYASPAGTPVAPPAGTPVVPPAVGPGSAADQLTGWLCHWLDLDRIDPDASLYDLGADSLLLLNLLDEVTERFGVSLALSQLSHQVSLAEVLGLLGETARAEGSTPDTVPLEVWQVGSGRSLLCLVHPVGGDIQAYRSLVSALDPTLTVCLVADPALARPDHPAWSLAERARVYHATLRDRFPPGEWRWRLAGWSFGAWVALAMAAEAERAGDPVDDLYLIDPPPPEAGPHFQAYDDERLEALFAHELGAATDTGRAAKTYADALARCCRANLASMASYTLPRLTGTPSQLWLASRPTPGLPMLGTPQAQAQQWRAHLPGLVAWHRVDTTHYGIVAPQHARTVAETINKAVP